jgi:uncharacterized phage-associated protein
LIPSPPTALDGNIDFGNPNYAPSLNRVLMLVSAPYRVRRIVTQWDAAGGQPWTDRYTAGGTRAEGSVDRAPFPLFTGAAVKTATTNRSEEKLQQVILYFLERINNVHLGRTKLMKLLYFVDFNHYEAHGAPVTGANYRKLPHGPYPDKIEKLIAKMERAGLVREVKADHKGYTQHRLITLNGKFDPAKFSGTELQALERVAADWADATAAQIEAATHREAPWAGTQAGKKIDYEMAEYRRAIGFEPLDESLAGSKKFADYVAALA